jgi:radical SAM superfamily enzyme YgiQ (UPF0313 family)
MNIGLIDADLLDKGTRHPNLALMKISGYHLEVGDTTKLLESYDNINNYDKVYISKVFKFTDVDENRIDFDHIVKGGTGFFENNSPDLPECIEHHKPDYNLYDEYVNKKLASGIKRSHYKDYLDYSIGFTTRGCFRKCEFCVNNKYDRVVIHSPLNEFLDEKRPYINLWDDNFLAFKDWKKVLNELSETGKPFQFRQGLDIRLMTEEKAIELSRSRYKGDFIFAFDFIKDRDLIVKKLKIWKKHIKKTTKLYVLTGYESQDIKDIENTLERIKILMKHGCLPYIMRYEDYTKSEFKSMYIQLARWCNQPRFFKKMSFRQFAMANQKYHKNPKTKCSTMKVLDFFDESFPELAKKYFDLRYENLNLFN